MTDSFGRRVEVRDMGGGGVYIRVTPTGGMRGHISLSTREALDEFRGLLDRAAMPGQRAEPVTSCVCGKQIEPCKCGGTVCTGWGHVHRNATRHWCGLRKEDGQPKPAEVSGG